MPRRPGLALILALAALSIWSVPPWAGTSRAEYVGGYTWDIDDPRFGGLSGLEVSGDGLDFVAITDRGTFVSGRLKRDSGGAVIGVERADLAPILGTDGQQVRRKDADPEGLAVDDAGRIYVSFEANHRVWAYDAPGGVPEVIPQHGHFARLQDNSGMEALAIDADGRVYTLPERSGRLTRPFPVYRFDGQWTQPFTLPRDADFLPVGADFGPDGKLYLLERDFRGVFGFFTRVRRFEIGEESAGPGEVVLETAVPFQNNFEGIAVWQDANGAIRLTLISDDNFTGVLTTEFADYRLVE